MIKVKKVIKEIMDFKDLRVKREIKEKLDLKEKKVSTLKAQY